MDQQTSVRWMEQNVEHQLLLSAYLVRRLTKLSSVVIVDIHGKQMFRLYQDELG